MERSLGRETTAGNPKRAVVTMADARACLAGRSGLVIDDDGERFGRMFVSLSTAGCPVRLARSFEQARQMLSREVAAPALVILSADLGEGPADVAGIVGWLRAQPRTREAILVAIAGIESRRERRRLIDAGCDGYLARAVDARLFAQDLLAAVPRLQTLR